MHIPPERVGKIATGAPNFGFKIRAISLDNKIRKLAGDVRKRIREHHQGSFVLFEEAVKFALAFEDFQFEREDRSKEATPFVLLVCRISRDLVAIRQLLLIGQESGALALGRVLLEDIELAMATAADPTFAADYMDADASDEFWSKRVGYGRIYALVEKFLNFGGPQKEIVNAYIARHKMMKSFLSKDIHPSASSAFYAALPPIFESPGYFARRPLGHFGSNSGRLCLYIAEEIHAFSAACINAFIKPNPPPALANYKPDKRMAAFMLPAHTLQALVMRYSKRLHLKYDKKAKMWDEREKMDIESTAL